MTRRGSNSYVVMGNDKTVAHDHRSLLFHALIGAPGTIAGSFFGGGVAATSVVVGSLQQQPSARRQS
jgi:hypothetical protein